MSFFSSDVVAKEQLPGAVGSAMAAAPAPVLPTPGFGTPAFRRRIRKKQRLPTTLLEQFHEYLTMKVKQHASVRN